MYGIRTLIASTALALGLAPAAHAQVANGSFETGDFSSWSITGYGVVVDAGFGATPTDGAFQGLITTGGSTLQSSMEAFLGLPFGTLDAISGENATAGTAIKTTINVRAGSTIEFDWNFVCNDFVPFNDFGFVVIDGVATVLADVAQCDGNPSPTGFQDETGYFTFSHTFEVGGEHTIGFGVSDVRDSIVDSGLLIDNLHIVREPICGWRTQTQAEWGDPNDPAGIFMWNTYNKTFKWPGLDLGCGNTFVSYQSRHAIDLHLPVSGAPRALQGEEVCRRFLDGYFDIDENGNVIPRYDPEFGTRLWGETTALGLNVGYDALRSDFTLEQQPHPLSELVVSDPESPCVDLTVGEVLQEAQNVLFSCGSPFTPDEISTCVTLVNNAFRDGADDPANPVCTIQLDTP